MSAGSLPSRSWPVTYCTRRACARCVSETSRRDAAPCAAEMPGTTSTGMSAARQAAISSPARPKIIGSPPLSRTTRLPDFRELDHQVVDLALLARRPVAGLADHHLLRLAPREIEHLRRDEIVDENDVGGLQRAHGAQGEQLRIARAGADQHDRTRIARDAARLRPSRHRCRSGPARAPAPRPRVR